MQLSSAGVLAAVAAAVQTADPAPHLAAGDSAAGAVAVAEGAMGGMHAVAGLQLNPVADTPADTAQPSAAAQMTMPGMATLAVLQTGKAAERQLPWPLWVPIHPLLQSPHAASRLLLPASLKHLAGDLSWMQGGGLCPPPSGPSQCSC